MKGTNRTHIILLTFLFSVLGGFLTCAWGDDDITYSGTDTQGWMENGANVYEAVFDNPNGITQISYTYNSFKPKEGKTNPPADGLIVEYSLDSSGDTYTEWNRKDGGSNINVVDAIPVNHPARNAKRFRFRARGVYGWHAVWGLSIRTTNPVITLHGKTKLEETITEGVRFYITGRSDTYSDYGYTSSPNSMVIQWTVPNTYVLSVKGVTIRSQEEEYWGSQNHSFYSTTRKSTETRIYSEHTWTNVTFDESYFPLGKDSTISVRAETRQYQYKDVWITYTLALNTFDVSLDSEGGTDGSASVGLTYDLNTHAAITNPTKEGCTFEGWYSGDNGTGDLVIAADGTLQANVTGYTGASGVWKNADDDVTLHAKWSGVPYSVRFNGNGSTGGSMSNQAFEYGTAKKLTANGFEKTCTVTYDANGGSCGIAYSETDYPFSGWATSAAGDVVYEDEEEVGDLTTTEDAVVDLYAKWSASPNAVELPTPTKENSVFTGWYNADEDFIGNAGDSYTPSGNETLKARWKPGASSENNNDDVSDGKIVINGPHAAFTIAGPTDIYYYTDGSCGDDGYFLASIDEEQSKTYTLSWSCDPSCTIEVTKISFWAKAYNWATGRASKAKVIFNEKTTSVGTAALTCSSADYAKLTESGSFSSPMTIECQNTFDVGGDVIPPYDFDFYLKNIVFEYTITPNAPTPHDADLAATLSESAKQTLDVKVNSGSLFTMTSPAADFAYTYRLKEAYPYAHLEEDGSFWATATGDYVIQARVASGTDHEASEWSECTVHVVRTCVFENTEKDKDWSNEDNWLYEATPAVEGNDSVRVIGDVVLDEEVKVRGLFIGDTANIEIAPVGGMTVGAGGISGATSDKLVLRASDAGKTGYLRVSPACTKAMPTATVELYSIAYANNATRTATWQYVGIPVASGVGGWDICTYGQQFIYGWSEATGEWSDAYPDVIAPFQGYCLTQNNNSSGLTFTFTGQLTAPRTKEIPLSYDGTGGNKGYHVLANSYTAPIDITKMESTDFGGATGTIYLFNTGTYNESGYTVDAANSTTAGQYVAVTPGTAAGIYASDKTYPIMIPAMQGFCVQTNTSTTLTLDYSKIVWGANYGEHPNQPMRVAAQRTEEVETNEPNVTDFIKVTLSDGEAGDNLYLLASAAYEKSYENGFDAPKMMSDDPALPNIFAVEDDEQLAIDATSDIDGTFLGVRTGQASNYTLYFSHVSGETEWMLLDVQTNEKTKIADETSYSFSAAPNSLITNRFLIVAAEENTGTTTGSDEITIENKIQKFIYNNHLRILRDGVLYDAQGRVVSR